METGYERGSNTNDRDTQWQKSFSHHQEQDRETDTNEAAIAEGTTPERVQRMPAGREWPDNSQSPAAPGQLRPDRLQDGYSDTEGREYEREQPAHEQIAGRDPAHSGARHARNKPGTPATAPGREEGTAWGENKQTGQGQNPKNPSD